GGGRRREIMGRLRPLSAVLECAMVVWCSSVIGLGSSSDPTHGFTQVAFRCSIQKPYDRNVSERFSFHDGVYDFRVYSTDKPHFKGSATKPRTELRVLDHDYTSGVWQFEGDFYVASSTTGVCIMQVFGGRRGVGPTALRLHIVNKDLIAYNEGTPSKTVANSITGRWVHLNVIHDADEHTMAVYIDSVLTFFADNASDKSHYFKCGVYEQHNPSSYMESQWKNIILWRKSGRQHSIAQDQFSSSPQSCVG
ncbi:hypothetical protein GOP47_0015157, partial [Adiantum capillus-veneris]